MQKLLQQQIHPAVEKLTETRIAVKCLGSAQEHLRQNETFPGKKLCNGAYCLTSLPPAKS